MPTPDNQGWFVVTVESITPGNPKEAGPIAADLTQQFGPLQSEIGGARHEGTHVVHALGVVHDELPRRHLPTTYGVSLLERGQVVELAHAPDAIRPVRGGGGGGRR